MPEPVGSEKKELGEARGGELGSVDVGAEGSM